MLLVYFKRFGGYLSVITCAVLIEAWAQLLISLAIAFTILTDVPTVYTAPPFSGRMTPLQNMFSHVTFSLSFGSLFGAAMGCVLLWILRVLVPPESFQKHG